MDFFLSCLTSLSNSILEALFSILVSSQGDTKMIIWQAELEFAQEEKEVTYPSPVLTYEDF